MITKALFKISIDEQYMILDKYCIQYQRYI